MEDDEAPVHCAYCPFQEKNVDSVLEHCVFTHFDVEIAYKKYKCQAEAYVTHRFKGTIPAEVYEKGKTFQFLGNGKLSIIKAHSKQTPIAKKKALFQAHSPGSAPEPLSKVNQPSSKKSLFLHDPSGVFEYNERESQLPEETYFAGEQEQEISELIDLLPSVIDSLRSAGQLDTYMKFNRLLSAGQFPLSNVCYKLFLDLVEWFAAETTSEMRYKFPDTLQFWKIGYRLFKGKFLRFMSGPKGLGEVLTDPGKAGVIKPHDSKVNFAVPSKQVLMKQDGSMDMLKIFPGVIDTTIANLASVSRGKPMKLGIDGKKISRGRGRDMGDVDCWGFEAKPTLQEKRATLAHEMQSCEKLDSVLLLLEAKGYDKLQDIQVDKRSYLTEHLQSLIKLVGLKLRQLREQKLALKRSFEKFKKIAGEDWRNSRFLPILSSIRTSQFDVELNIKAGLDSVDECGFLVAVLNNTDTNYAHLGPVDLSRQKNHFAFDKVYGTHRLPSLSSDSRNVKQRTPEWFEIRKTSMATGSTMANAVGLNGLKKQQQHFDQVFFNVERPSPSPEQQKNMQYGTDHETDAVATLVSKVLPVYFPGARFFEEGCRTVSCDSADRPVLVVSPDGSVRNGTNDEIIMMYETKCKPPCEQTTEVYYNIPTYYAPQILAEMAAYGSERLLFTCWSEESTVVMSANYDRSLFEKLQQEVIDVFGIENPRRPNKIRPVVKELKQEISKYLESSVEFVAEFPSVNVDKSNVYRESSQQSSAGSEVTNDPKLERVSRALRSLKMWFSTAHSLLRQLATEILVFMLNDTDREFQMDINNAHPVAYAMKGPSMNVDTFRQLTNHVISQCEEGGLPILAVSTDGQWHNFGIRDEEGTPYTLFQLQKDVWKEIKSETKPQLIGWIKNQVAAAAFSCQTMPILRAAHLLLMPGLGRKRRTTLSHAEMEEEEHDKENQTDMLAQDISAQEDSFIDGALLQKLDNVLQTANDRTTPPTCISESIVDTLSDSLSVLFHVPCDGVSHSNDDMRVDVAMPAPVSTFEGNEMFTQQLTESNPDSGILFVSQESSNEYCDEHGQVISGNMDLSSSYARVDEAPPTRNVLNTRDYTMMLKCLSAEQHSLKTDWSVYSVEDFQLLFQSVDTINKSFDKKALKCCLQSALGKIKTIISSKVTISAPKYRLAEVLFEAGGGKCISKSVTRKSRKTLNPQALKSLCLSVISSYPKEILAALKAETVWTSKVDEWRGKQSSFEQNCTVEGTDYELDWFSSPLVGRDGCIRFHFTDACHLLTCLRTKICTHGIPGAGLQRKAWEEAAMSRETSLNIAVVLDCLDKQSVEFAKRVIGQDVEDFMVRHGYHKEASFCCLLRQWFQAEDDPGIPAEERCRRRLKLRAWLLQGVDFGHFPPLTRYIRGIPAVTYEGLLTHCERKIQLYECCPGHAYNARALGSQEVEQLFCTFRDLDPGGTGTPKPDDIPHMMAVSSEIDNFRLNPDRSFHMRTSKAAVYPEATFHKSLSSSSVTFQRIQLNNVHHIFPRDHFFDTASRQRLKKRKKKSSTVSSPCQPSRGEMGVRQYHRRDESKILPHVRRGLPDIPQ